ncbi:MAG: F0F1 ATP synthase subunit A [Candidatus Saccharimonadales bacterium]
MFAQFASSLPKTHIAPQTVFHLGSLAISNSILLGWIATVIMIVVFIVVARRMTVRPKGGITQIIEYIAEFMTGTVTDAFEEKERAAKYVPFFVTVFFFVLVNNLVGIIPGVGDSLTSHGTSLFRPMTADFNTTLAMAAIMMTLVYVSSVREVGIKDYFSHFFMGSLKNPLYLFIGLIEMITDITRVLSLSLRLFLNVAIVETIVVVFAYLGHIIAPVTAVPFYFLDIFDDLLQAYIFALLGAMYLAIAVNHVAEHRAEKALTESQPAETMGANPKQTGEVQSV